MLSYNTKIWKAAEDLYYSLVEKESFELLSNKIKTYIELFDKYAEHNQPVNKMYELFIIYYVSMTVSDEEIFGKVTDYLKEFGIDYSYSNSYSDDAYCISKLCSADEQNKKILMYFLEMDIYARCLDYSILYLLCLMKSPQAEEIMSSICTTRWYANDLINKLIIFLIEDRRMEILDMVCRSFQIGIDAALYIAVVYPDLFYGVFREKYYKNIPGIFKYKNDLRPIDKLIPFLFKSKTFAKEAMPGKVGKLKRIYDIIGIENLRKIEKYIPKFRTLSSFEISTFLKEQNEFTEFVISKSGKKLHINGIGIRFLNKSFFEQYTHFEIYIDYSNVHEMMLFNRDLLEYFLFRYPGKINPLTYENKVELIKNILLKDTGEIVGQLIQVGIITSETIEDTIEFAVENNALNVLDEINLNYSRIMSCENDTDSNGD